MNHRLNFLLIVGLLIHGAYLRGQIPETSDSHSFDNILESPFDPVKADVEDPVELLWAEVEAIIQELDQMTLMPDETAKSDIKSTDHVNQVTGTDSLDHDADPLNHSIDRIIDGYSPGPIPNGV